MDGDEDSGCDEDVLLRRGGHLRTAFNVDRDRKATRIHSGDELVRISEELIVNHKDPERSKETNLLANNTDKGRGLLLLCENNLSFTPSHTFVRTFPSFSMHFLREKIF